MEWCEELVCKGSKLLHTCTHTHSSLEPPATKRPRPLAHPSPSPSLDLDPTPTSVMEAQEQPAQTSEEVGGVAPPMDTQVSESQVRRNTDGRRKTQTLFFLREIPSCYCLCLYSKMLPFFSRNSGPISWSHDKRYHALPTYTYSCSRAKA